MMLSELSCTGYQEINIGALVITYIIFGVPCYIYGVIYPKTLF